MVIPILWVPMVLPIVSESSPLIQETVLLSSVSRMTTSCNFYSNSSRFNTSNCNPNSGLDFANKFINLRTSSPYEFHEHPKPCTSWITSSSIPCG